MPDTPDRKREFEKALDAYIREYRVANRRPHPQQQDISSRPLSLPNVMKSGFILPRLLRRPL